MGNKVVPLALQTSWQLRSHKQERQQGQISLRARAQHKGSRQWTSPADDYSRLIISGPITSSPLNTELGIYKQFRWKVPAPCKQKEVFLQQSFSLDSGVPCTPKVSIPSWVVSKEAVMKDPMYLPIHLCLQEQMQLTVKDAPRHIWIATQLEPAHCLLPHASWQNN